MKSKSKIGKTTHSVGGLKSKPELEIVQLPAENSRSAKNIAKLFSATSSEDF